MTNREVLVVEVDTNLSAGRVVRVLDRIAEERGHYPERLRMDNGPEFIGSTMAAWSEVHGVALAFIQPGTPTQNSFVERFNRTYRTEVLDLYVLTAWMRSERQQRVSLASTLKSGPMIPRGHASDRVCPPALRLLQNFQPRVSTHRWR